MLALIAHGAHDLRIEETPFTPSPNHAIIRPTRGGICGSDLHYAAEGRVGAYAIREPLVLGHEVVGVVEKDPSGLFTTGARVAVHPASWDGTCPPCEAGATNLCINARYLGSAASDPHTQGGFSQRLAVRPDQLRLIPPVLSDDRAVLAEPLGVALHALARAGDIRGRRVHISGAGPIGLLVLRAAVRLGAAHVTVADVLDDPLRRAHELGANDVFALSGTPAPSDSADVVIEAAGAPAALTASIDVVRRGGNIVQVGMLPAGPLGVELARLVGKEVNLRGAFRFTTEIDDALTMLAADDGFDRIVTHVLPFTAATEAFRIAADPNESSKVVLDFQS